MKPEIRVKKIKEIYATTGAVVVVVGLLYMGIAGFFGGSGSGERLEHFSLKSPAKHI